MSNEEGNPDIHIHGRNTRFGASGGLDPREAARRSSGGSIRAAQRRLACFEVDYSVRIEPMMLARAFHPKGTALTVAQAIAVARMYSALRGDIHFSQKVTEDLDGKLTHPARSIRTNTGRSDQKE